MSQILVTGSIGIDTVETPTGTVRDCLGGSATYFALAAERFCPVRLVAVAGEDFPEEYRTTLQARRIDTAGLEIRRGSRTFRWHGRYSRDMNSRTTVEVQLNVLAERGPTIPAAFRDSEYVFLANNDPALQLEFLDQLAGPRLAVCDTMDLWIREHRDNLRKVLRRVDGVILNDSEARDLTEQSNLRTAARRIHELGPKYVVIKKGEHGAILFAGEDILAMPAYPTEKVIDPTGAGDSFAGGLMGHLARVRAARADGQAWREGLLYATVIASFTVESFSVSGLTELAEPALERRLTQFRRMIQP